MTGYLLIYYQQLVNCRASCLRCDIRVREIMAVTLWRDIGVWCSNEIELNQYIYCCKYFGGIEWDIRRDS
jgi:hypothetical protein